MESKQLFISNNIKIAPNPVAGRDSMNHTQALDLEPILLK